MPALILRQNRQDLSMELDVPPVANLEERAFLSSALARVLMGCSEATDDAIDDIDDGEHATLRLPLSSWRHLLHQIERGYRYELFNRAKASGRLGSASNGAPTTADNSQQRRLEASLRNARSAAKSKKASNSFESFIPANDERLTFESKGLAADSVQGIAAQDDLWASAGAFEVASGTLRVCDPCYDDKQDAGFIPAKNGEWAISVLLRDDNDHGCGNGMMPARLMVSHSEASPESLSAATFMAGGEAFSAGVDSGQCGFFDEGFYPKNKADFEHAEGSAFKSICDSISGGDDWEDANPMQAASVLGGRGAASRTFYGDGSYSVFVSKNEAGEAIGAVLVYDTHDPELALPLDDEFDDAPSEPKKPRL